MSVDSTEALRSESLDSWKEIAAYLKRDVRTVQRWERHEGLPVHRKLHDKVSSIYAYKSELDRWWRKESSDIASSNETALPRRPLLAVLPLRNLGLEQDNDYFSDGLTEELIAQLSRINPEQLGVIARASIARYKGNTTDINRIARELGASYIVDGIVRRSDRRVRVAVQLIGMSDQGHLWADSYDRDLQDVLELQAKIARAVTAQISIKLTAREEKRLKGSRAIAPEAYENYLRGRFFWNQRSGAGLTRAIELFERDFARRELRAGALWTRGLLLDAVDGSRRRGEPRAGDAESQGSCETGSGIGSAIGRSVRLRRVCNPIL